MKPGNGHYGLKICLFIDHHLGFVSAAFAIFEADRDIHVLLSRMLVSVRSLGA